MFNHNERMRFNQQLGIDKTNTNAFLNLSQITLQ